MMSKAWKVKSEFLHTLHAQNAAACVITSIITDAYQTSSCLCHSDAILSSGRHLSSCKGHSSIEAESVCNSPLLPTKNVSQYLCIQSCITAL